MTSLIRTKRQRVAWTMLVIFLVNLFYPVGSAYALTAGPTQPEVQGFTPAGTTDMVDTFSGDFNYNIPLFELPGPNGGYPFNLSYQAGITQDQEASWVGLGWSLNLGAINRQMRGLPDEFKGDEIHTQTSIKPSVTVGVGVGTGVEIFGGASDIGSVGLSVFQNSYKGFGYSIDGFAPTIRLGMTTSLRGGITLNSQEGASVNASLSLSGKIGEIGLSSGFNTMRGLEHVTLTDALRTDGFRRSDAGSETKRTTKGFVASASSALTLASKGYTPQVSMPFNNVSISARFNVGGAWMGVFPKGYLNGYYTEQYLKHNGEDVISHGYGYLNYEKQTDASEYAVLDLNREKDGMVSTETPNLGIPSRTYDIYSVTGQGISAMYRPLRTDAGILHDPEVVSRTTGGSVGIDGAPELSHGGVNLSLNLSKSTSGRWTDNNEMATAAKFASSKIDDDYEPWTFRVHGEQTSVDNTYWSQSLLGDPAVRVKLTGPTSGNPDAVASTKITYPYGEGDFSEQEPSKNFRDKRSEVIQSFTNEQIMSATGNELIKFFKNKYYVGSDTFHVNRIYNPTTNKNAKPHHIAGFTALTSDGLRYNYTIPVYNSEQQEVTFSASRPTGSYSKVEVNGSDEIPTHSTGDQFLKKTKIPPYAHSYLLTSIVGPDYVDIGENGVDDQDLGYWVKFTYERTTSDYQWRDPFSKAHFVEGWRSDSRDDKGSYTYGRKELWFLKQAETKSHVAVFDIADRYDGRDSSGGALANDNSMGSTSESRRLECISLYSRHTFNNDPSQRYPIKKVLFKYTYALCAKTPNSLANSTHNPNRGKLTLKKVWFQYGNTDRGKLNPYEFSYNENDTTNCNPSYNAESYDRWGVYRPNPRNASDPAFDKMYNIDFPYSDQDPANKNNIDSHVAAWSLRGINTPSGSKIIIDYETDDYGYVQHKQAMQMVSIAGATDKFNLSASDLTIKFKLERSVSSAVTDSHEHIKEVLKYVDPKQPLFFKAFMNLHDPGSTGYQEFIAGYVDVDPDTNSMTLERDTEDGDWVYGTFKVKKETYKLAGTTVNVHPFTMRTWQHLRTNQPEFARNTPPVNQTSDNVKRFNLIRSLTNSFGDIKQMLEGFNEYCRTNHWGEEIQASKSWIRLKSPDKTKYGGGIRVRQITVYDNWALDNYGDVMSGYAQDGIYGQIYDYTIIEDGATISSGVAANEPMIGGEENALRIPKRYTQNVWLRSDNNLYFDYPINESYYPGPHIGYRQVTVSSLASAALVRSWPPVSNATIFPSAGSFGTTGKTVYEYYTAKDFPVITDETDKQNVPVSVHIPVPFLGNLSVNKLTTSQGYSIITNDMHGKLHKVNNYRQASDGTFETDPISSVVYNYRAEKKIYQGEKVMSLKNNFSENDANTLIAPEDTIDSTAFGGFMIGQEMEFFFDMRQYEDIAWEGGANINADVVFIPFFLVAIPIPTVWPSIGKSTTQLRTAVANKIIFRSGVLKSVEAYDGASMVKTENVKWDKITGQVVLTKVNNNFDKPVFSYTIPAHTQYSGLGGAYQNIGLKLRMGSLLGSSGQYFFFSQLNNWQLYPGDELLLYVDDDDPDTDDIKDPVARGIYTEGQGSMRRLSLTAGDSYVSTHPSNHYVALIFRSGFRNQLNAAAGKITALKDPSKPGTSVHHPKKAIVPSNQ
ncbi:MAG: hypothetical protein WDO14_24565 [Bacteroidota bacterium]